MLFFYYTFKENDVDPTARASSPDGNAIPCPKAEIGVEVLAIQVAIDHGFFVPVAGKPGDIGGRTVVYQLFEDPAYGDDLVEVETVVERFLAFQRGGKAWGWYVQL